jgi:hypothetical protein
MHLVELSESIGASYKREEIERVINISKPGKDYSDE